MPTLLRMPDYPVAGQPLRRGWGVAVVDQIRALNQRTAPRLPPPLRAQAPEVALTWTVQGAQATLSAGYLILRGELIAVESSTVTLTSDEVVAWLQFTITPGLTPAPEVQTGVTIASVDLGTTGVWPLAKFFTALEGGSRIVTRIRHDHPGGNIGYPV